MKLSFTQTNCSVCGNPIGQPIPGKIYCSRKCRVRAARIASRALNKRLRRGEIVKREVKPCAQCGADFMPGRKNQIFCSATCRHRAGNLRNALWSKAQRDVADANPRPWLEPRACKHCEALFQPRHHMQFYCSLPCRVLAGGETLARALKAAGR